MARMANFGEKSWDEESASSNGRSDFFNMKKDGQYKVRVVGKPHEYGVHWVDAGGVRKKVNCAAKDCLLCAKGLKANVRYMIPAIFRSGPDVKEGSIRVTEFGPQVFGAIRSLYKTPEWGNPNKYDIIIDKDKSRGASGTYFVTPAKEYPLTDKEKADVVDFLERVNLKELSAAMPNELIIEKLGPDMCAALGIDTGDTDTGSSTSSGSDFDFEDGGDEYSFGDD